ncbi:MAG: hypothetical protein WD055_03560 [Candidatus Dependentiae bacterium]
MKKIYMLILLNCMQLHAADPQTTFKQFITTLEDITPFEFVTLQSTAQDNPNMWLLYGIDWNKPEIMKFALQYNADPNWYSPRNKKETNLEKVISKIKKQNADPAKIETMIRILLDHKADPTIITKNGKSLKMRLQEMDEDDPMYKRLKKSGIINLINPESSIKFAGKK